jgi:DNA-directed RNA polymerase specialized sigma24 family protein
VLGSAFTGTLREAQAGDEQAFTRLWRDANPLVIRYLRVVGADDPYDAACEGWITAIRGLIGFTGDESAWRVWILACARLRAEQGTGQGSWATVTPIDRRAFSQATTASSAATAATAATAAAAATMARRRSDADEFDIDALLAASPDTDPAHRGLGDTITALRALPLGQGEILVLRLGGALPVRAVSDVVGSDAESVRRSEARALERLGADAELLTWSLDAPATPAELADERVALGAFRSIPRPPAWSVPRTRVVTVGNAPARRGAKRPHGIANAAGRSRTALLGIATISASVMSLGGLSAAAYVGALPTGVQRLMHETIGAPAPGASRSGAPKPKAPGSPASSRPSNGIGRILPGGGVAPVQPTAEVTAPGKGKGKGGTKTGSPSPTSTSSVTGSVPHGTGSPTRAPSTGSTATSGVPSSHTPNSHSTKTKAPTTKAPRTKAPGSHPTKGPATGSGDSTVSSTTGPSPTSTTDVTNP